MNDLHHFAKGTSVETYDDKPRQRVMGVDEIGMKDNQQVVSPTAARPFHPCSEHVIDWFHITMRLTLL